MIVRVSIQHGETRIEQEADDARRPSESEIREAVAEAVKRIREVVDRRAKGSPK